MERMPKPRIRHIALNVQNRDETADYYKKIFGLEEKYRGPNGTIYLSAGHVGVALISRPEMPWGIKPLRLRGRRRRRDRRCGGHDVGVERVRRRRRELDPRPGRQSGRHLQ